MVNTHELEPEAQWRDVVVADDPAFAALRPSHVRRNTAQETLLGKAVYAAVALQRQGLPILAETLHAENGNISHRQWRELLESEKYLEALEERGITVGTVRGCTPPQMSALAIYFDTTLKMNHTQRLRAAGVRSAQWQGWLRQAPFAAEYSRLAEERIRGAEGLALQRTAEAVDAGERWAIELTLEITGRHDRRPRSVDLNALFMGLYTILDDEGIPGETLARIGSRVKDMLGGGAPQPQGVTITVPAAAAPEGPMELERSA